MAVEKTLKAAVAKGGGGGGGSWGLGGEDERGVVGVDGGGLLKLLGNAADGCPLGGA